MAASSLAAARAALLRLAYSASSATSSRPLPASAALAARAAVRCLAHDAAATPSTSSSSGSPSSSSSSAYRSASAAASHVPTRWQEDRAAGAARSPATATVAVPSSWALSASATADSGVTTSGPVHKDADDAASSPRTHTVAVLPAMIRGLARKAGTAAASSLTSSGIWSGFTCGQRQLSTSAWANNMGSYPQLKSVQFLISLLNGMVLTKEEELIFRKAFNEKYSQFKVADILNHLETEELNVEECVFLLKMIHGKLRMNKGLAAHLSPEVMNLFSTNCEALPVLVHLEAKIDVLEAKVELLTTKVTEGDSKILEAVKAPPKGEWGSLDVLGKKLDLTKLEYLKKSLEYLKKVLEYLDNFM